eukprot:1159659-Pelagomonas_calceolata.AAC.3
MMPNVEVLSLSVNHIPSLRDFRHCTKLQVWVIVRKLGASYGSVLLRCNGLLRVSQGHLDVIIKRHCSAWDPASKLDSLFQFVFAAHSHVDDVPEHLRCFDSHSQTFATKLTHTHHTDTHAQPHIAFQTTYHQIRDALERTEYIKRQLSNLFDMQKALKAPFLAMCPVRMPHVPTCQVGPES